MTLRSISQRRLRCVCRKRKLFLLLLLLLFIFLVASFHDFDLITAIAFVHATCGFSHAVRRVSKIRISREGEGARRDSPEQGVNNDAMHTNEFAGNII